MTQWMENQYRKTNTINAGEVTVVCLITDYVIMYGNLLVTTMKLCFYSTFIIFLVSVFLNNITIITFYRKDVVITNSKSSIYARFF